ncbi:MAG: SUMF1/EgtB/PvdO family nonheme iron enzyme [Oscillatoria princeps RMCB-10]|jgi:formylglycine-generating enzyme required for sulfatase activity/tRNA A-37 threonylcarbamoyl transferase component Bud32|nr:SUMF1/EgtB/PvdO family nonheme iron enzyme [Oscillatoria princeps RMCB-10]
MSGQILAGRYKIVKYLGGGGFGQTFLAKDTQLPDNPVCVVKQLKPQYNDPSTLQIARRLFDTEARVLQKLGEHDQIPRLLAHFEENQEFYLVQQFIDGDSLCEEIQPTCKWTEERTVAFLLDVLTALSYAHQQGVIHRDIKPANLIRRRQDGKIVLIDFGAVKQVSTGVVNAQQSQTSLTVGIGTPGYMPSEQAKGKPQLSSDVYALGITAIQALTGIPPERLPEDPVTGEILWRNWAQVSPNLATILDKMVRYDYRQRYSSAPQALQAVSSLTKANSLTRRQIVKLAGFAGGGFVASVFARQVFTSPPSSPIVKVSPSPPPLPQAEKGVDTSPTVDTSPSPNQEKGSSGGEGKTLQTFAFDAITVDAQGREINRTRRQAEYFTHDLGGGVILEMVSIPGGTFMMGSPQTESMRDDDEGPQHLVTVQPFFMGKYAVTQAQWKVVAALPKVNRDLNPDPSRFKGANRPVENVSWEDATEFCARLSKKTGLDYRLPSEAEWEYACRAGTTTPFHFGETITTDLANYNGNYTYASGPKGKYRQETTDVGSFPPNAFGLYDMHGNVWEWCADPWHDNYAGAPVDGSVWSSGGNEDRQSRMLRGGSWYYYPRDCRAALRNRSEPEFGDDDVGFRAVVSLLRT